MPRYRSILLCITALGCGGSAGDADVIVDPPSSRIASVIIAPGPLSLVPGATGQLDATARDARGGLVPGAAITWTTSASDVATVSAGGLVTAVDGGTATITATAGGFAASVTANVEYVYDVTTRGVPKIVVANYIDPAVIARVSRFRSGIGHDYSDVLERCRSMKHYFMPFASVDWATVTISSPIAGTITDAMTETTFGTQLRIASAANPAFTVILFHVKPDAGIGAGTAVTAGQRLGTHIGSQTMSDIAIRVRAKEGTRYVSYFDAMTDAVFQPYVARGMTSRSAASITAAERDGNPLSCDGEAFLSTGTLENWFVFP